MAKVGLDNPRYRTIEEIAEDIVIANKSKLSYSAKFSIFNEITWIVAEMNGKYKNQQFFSKKAYKEIKDGNINISRPEGKLILEHSVPKDLLRNKMFAITNPDEAIEFLKTYFVGVVILKEEDQKLNENGLKKEFPEDVNFDFTDPTQRFLRYNHAKIDVVEVIWENNKLIGLVK